MTAAHNANDTTAASLAARGKTVFISHSAMDSYVLKWKATALMPASVIIIALIQKKTLL